MSPVPPFRHALAAGLAGLFCFGSVGSAGATAGDATITSPAAEASTSAEQGSPVISDVVPAVSAAIRYLNDQTLVRAYAKDDAAAALQFYGARKDPLWVDAAGFTGRAKALAAEIAKAEQWGLDARSYPLPDLTQALDVDAQGRAEVQLTLAALTYARHAKGGRVRPLSISQLLDLSPPVRDPGVVLKELEAATDPAAFLVGLHPKHEQFQRLRAELVKRLGPVEPPAPVDPALLVKLPPTGTTIRPGSLHPDVALLRKRLKQPPAFAGQETLYDEKLSDAIKAFQTEKGLKANGQMNNRTRAALNREGQPAAPDTSRDTQRIVVNMERWRWMPDDLGGTHVLNNVPEFVTRTYKDGSVILKEKIIVGLPDWPTPSFSAEMKTIVFNPSWGVPDGIKAKELKPRLQRAGGNGFFDQLFGGGGGASVIRAYGFTPYRNGKPVNPDSVDWSTADLRQYSFIQPPGGENPLGFVKFMFPNSHDVYMHDTTQRHLFAQSRRAYSHGCIRVNDPMRFAEVLMEQDKGWSRDRAAAARRSSETVALDNHIWVHTVYLTAWIGDDGEVMNFGDIYGLDSRVSQALGGRALRPVEPTIQDDVETASLGDETTPRPAKKKKTSGAAAKSKPMSVPGSFSEAMSGLVAN